MTEQEAIETLQDMHDVAECRIKSGDNRGVIYIPEEELAAFDMAFKALEEIEKYRTIGTPDECRAAVEKQQAKRPHPYIAFDGIERNGCPRCFEESGQNEILYAGQKYCSACGQRLER